MGYIKKNIIKKSHNYIFEKRVCCAIIINALFQNYEKEKGKCNHEEIF